MSKFSVIFISVIVFFCGVLAGLSISPYKPSTQLTTEYVENYTLLVELRNQDRRQLLEFYMNYYCENMDFRIMDIKYNGVLFQGGYCDKNTVILLDDAMPPLPFIILEIEDKTPNGRYARNSS